MIYIVKIPREWPKPCNGSKQAIWHIVAGQNEAWYRRPARLAARAACCMPAKALTMYGENARGGGAAPSGRLKSAPENAGIFDSNQSTPTANVGTGMFCELMTSSSDDVQQAI